MVPRRAERFHVMRPASPAVPFAPQPFHFESESVQCLEVAGDAVVRIVTSRLATQRRLLFAQRPVPMSSAPLANSLQRSAESVFGRLALHNPSPLPGASPIVGEPNIAKLRSRCEPPRVDFDGLQNSTIRVLSGCGRRPYFSSRFANTPSTRLASSWCSNTGTASSGYRTSKARPRSRGFTSCSNHWSSTSCR